MKKLYALSAIVFLMCNAATAQDTKAITREQTFRLLGSDLQSIADTLQAGEAKTPPPGTTKKIQQPTPIYSKANKNSEIGGVVLLPNTNVRVLANENGFSKVLPATGNWDKGPVYMNQSSWSIPGVEWVSNKINSSVSDAIKKIEDLAEKLRNNPYVRLKGFKVSIAAPPSIDVDFEMKK